MIVLVGVDAGSSHTEAVVADDTLHPLARRRGRGAAVHPGGIDASAAAITEVVRDALGAAGASKPDALVVGAAGAGREQERTALTSVIADALDGPRLVLVTTDAAIALEAAFHREAGIILNAGSGSIAYARDPAGVVWRAGGLGWQFGDDGSAYAMARAALGMVGRAADGRGPRTALTNRIAEAIGASTLDEMIRWTQSASRPAVAALAPHVCDVAVAGDEEARKLVRQTAIDLADHLAALLRRFPAKTNVPVALMGGLLTRESPVRSALRAICAERMPQIAFVENPVDPPMGAIAMAAGLVG